MSQTNAIFVCKLVRHSSMSMQSNEVYRSPELWNPFLHLICLCVKRRRQIDVTSMSLFFIPCRVTSVLQPMFISFFVISIIFGMLVVWYRRRQGVAATRMMRLNILKNLCYTGKTGGMELGKTWELARQTNPFNRGVVIDNGRYGQMTTVVDITGI